MIKIISIVGARPQFIKATVVSREIAKHADLREIIIHTGQHFDKEMSEIFFKELKIRAPKYYLNINCLTHGSMTGRMLESIEKILLAEKPDIVLVYGDTNTTLSGALAAKKLHIKVAHVEAGLRSFNLEMPEEINRIVADRMSDILFCPTEAAINNLKKEGFANFRCRIVRSGDVMQDTAYYYSSFAKKPDIYLNDQFVLVTIHRAENTDNPHRLTSIFSALNKISKEIPVILPLHPRTKNVLGNRGFNIDFRIVKPVGYLEMIYLIQKCSLVMTDSGGLQKEAFFFKKPCITLRDETEWVELVENGYNLLAGSNSQRIYKCYKKIKDKSFNFRKHLYGRGNASKIIVKELYKSFN